MAKSKLDKAINILICVCGIMIMYLSVISIMWFRRTEPVYTIQGFNKREDVLIELYKEHRRQLIVNTNKHYRTIIEKDLGCYFYLYKETDLNDYAGKCFPTIRLIVIDKDIIGNMYCMTLAHEMMHLKLMRKQESYICFETFKYLYESEIMHDVGVWYAIKQIEGDFKGEYNVSNQIVDYLTNK